MTRKILECSVALFFLAMTVVVVIAGLNMAKVSAAAMGLLDESSLFVKESRKMVEETNRTQQELFESTRALEDILGEAGIAALAMGMSEQGMLPPGEADAMIDESIRKIEARSPRLGRLAGILNQQRPRSRRAASRAAGDYGTRLADAEANACLKNAYTASQAFFVDNPGGTATLEIAKRYGYMPRPGVSTIFSAGRQDDLAITTFHESGSQAFSVDFSGRITTQPR